MSYTRHDPSRTVRAPRGTEITARSWQTEAAMRMLMNNLDPEVAERPEDLVVYGGTGRAARSWEAFDAIVETLKELRDDETLLVQSGKPVGVLRTHEWAPRVLIANSNLVGDWANWEHFRKLEAEGLMMYGQMTAGSWIYIATQGILQGTYETFAAVANEHFGGTLAGTLTVTAGCGGMGGAQPLSVTLNGGACLIIDVDRSRLERRQSKRYLDEVVSDLDEALDLLLAAKADKRALSVGLVGNAADILPELLDRGVAVDIVTDQTSAHDPCPTCRLVSAWTNGLRKPKKTPKSSPCARRSRWRNTSPQWSASRTRARSCSTTATRSATKPAKPATTVPSNSPALCPPTFARCSARASAPSAGLPCLVIRKTSG